MISSEAVQEHILYDKIYQYLWVKSETSNPPAILIPDTVIIIRSMPIYWYYTDKETGEIRKKMRKNVTRENIKQTWLSKVGKSGVVAYLLHFIDNLDLNNPPAKLVIGHQIQIIYFDNQSFERYLNSEIELPFGILQKFVEPADERNSQIQAFWSKSITLFTKRQCKKQFNNKTMNIYERYCTFEGPEYLSEASQVKDFQSQRIQEQIDKMINHLDAISYGKLNIKQGTFYFKVDKEAQCWFLFCGNLKFEDDKNTNIPKDLYNQSQIKIPNSIDGLMSVYSNRPLQLEKDIRCVRCNKFDKRQNFCEIPYYYLIQFQEKPIMPEFWPLELKKEAKQVKLINHSESIQYINTISQVPITFQKIHQKVNINTYDSIKKLPGFQTKQVFVCVICYTELANCQEKIALQSVVSKLSPSSTMSSLNRTHSKQSLKQNGQKSLRLKDILKPKSADPKIKLINRTKPIQNYINLRLNELNLGTPKKYSIEQPSTAEFQSRKNKSVLQDIHTSQSRINGDKQTMSLQEKLSQMRITDSHYEKTTLKNDEK